MHCVAFFSLPCPLLPFSPFLSLRPVRSRALPALPSWLLVTLIDGLAPSAGVVRCPHGPTMRFFHQVMCLFDTSFSSCIEFASFLASTHFSYVVASSALSCPSWASTSFSSLPLSTHFFLLLLLGPLFLFLRVLRLLCLLPSPLLLSRLLLSPLFFSRLLRSPLLLTSLLLAFCSSRVSYTLFSFSSFLSCSLSSF